MQFRTVWQRLDERVLGLIVFAQALVLTLWDRFRILSDLAWVYTDKDQVLMWTAAYEFMHGNFHEPRFFGQAYNSLIEGLVAVVPVTFGLSYHVALPLVTVVLGLIPFFALAVCALRSGCPVSASLLATLPVLLPVKYAVISSMPRGFVTGTVLAIIPACLSLYPGGRASFMTSGFLLVLALSVNPSAAILAVPVGISIVLTHCRSRDLYLWGGSGALLGGILHFLSTAFYTWHPAHLVFDPPSIWPLNLSALFAVLGEPGRFLGAVTPVLPDQIWVLGLLFALAFAGIIVRGSRLNALALLSGLACIVVSFSATRIHEFGSDSIYFHWSRLYLAVPLLLGLGWLWAERASERPLPARLKFVLIGMLGILSLAVFIGRPAALDNVLKQDMQVQNAAGMQPWPVTEVQRRCDALREVAEANGAKLVVFQTIHKVVAYACEPILDQAIQTLLVRDFVPERRTWRLEQESRLQRHRMILYNFSPAQMAEARRLGVTVGRAVNIFDVAAVPVELPQGLDVFTLLDAIKVVGGNDLLGRVRQLSVESATEGSKP